MPRPGRPYGLKNRSKLESEMRISVEHSRAILMDVQLAKRTAKSRMTKAIRSGGIFDGGRVPDYAAGEHLKEGLRGMADTSGLDNTEMFGRLENMDADVLAEMYSQDKLTFEVVFNYEGIRRTGDDSKEYEVWNPEQKKSDFDFFINEYNRYAEATGRPRV